MATKKAKPTKVPPPPPRGEARNPELEASIRANVSDRAGYLVYSDWLMQQGDPRGELIAVQAKLIDNPTSIALGRAEEELFAKHADAFLGDFVAHQHLRTGAWGATSRSLVWWNGFIRVARLVETSEMSPSELATLLLEEPSARFLERLILGRGGDGQSDALLESELSAFLDVLEKHAPSTLSWFMLGTSERNVTPEHLDLTRLWSALPSLRTLHLGEDAEMLTLEAPEDNALEELHLAFAAANILNEVAAFTWPALKKVHVAFGELPTERIPMSELLDQMPSLEHLTARYWSLRRRGRSALEVALDIVQSCAKKKLRRLDLEVGLSEGEVKEVWKAKEGIELLTIPTHRGLKEIKSTKRPGFAWTKEPADEDFSDLDVVEKSLAAMDR